MRFQTFLFLTLLSLLLSNSVKSQNNNHLTKSNWPEPKESTYTVSSYNPVGNGYVLRNLKFSSEVRLTQPTRETYEWQVQIVLRSYDVVGYQYKGVAYSKNELINDFEISSMNYDASLKEIRVVFSNRKNINVTSLSRGSVNGSKNMYYIKYDEQSSFKIRNIIIYGDYPNPYIEGAIKRKLAITKPLDKIKNGSSTNTQSNNRNSSNKSGGLTIKPTRETEKESANNAAVSRRLAKRRKEEAERKKREFDNSMKKVEKSLGDAFSLGISSLINNERSLKFVYGTRTIKENQPPRSPLNASTLEIGVGFGKLGISVGYSLLDNQNELNTDTDNRRERAFGGTWAFGLDYTIYKFRFLKSDADIGINGEYGIGNLDFKVNSSSSDFNIDYSTNFYGIGAQIKFLNFLYVSYSYGKFTTKETRNSNNTSVLDPVDGFYTKLGFGVKYDFGY